MCSTLVSDTKKFTSISESRIDSLLIDRDKIMSERREVTKCLLACNYCRLKKAKCAFTPSVPRDISVVRPTDSMPYADRQWLSPLRYLYGQRTIDSPIFTISLTLDAQRTIMRTVSTQRHSGALERGSWRRGNKRLSVSWRGWR